MSVAGKAGGSARDEDVSQPDPSAGINSWTAALGDGS
jgi:hypothetical protein